MLILLSPSKKQNFKQKIDLCTYSEPLFKEETLGLVEKIKKYSILDIMENFNVSEKIANQVYSYYENWGDSVNEMSAAIAAYSGEAFTGLDAKTLSCENLEYAQDHLLILCSLYGILRPMDIIEAYRLDYKSVLNDINLYDFWKTKISEYLINRNDNLIVNLSSKEYSDSIDFSLIKSKCINVEFKEDDGDKLRSIVIYIKKARGAMARFIIENKVETIDELKKFDSLGYKYHSQEDYTLVFTRKKQ